MLTCSILIAIKVFYDQNVISVDVELFKLMYIKTPTGSDLSLTKRLLVTFNGSCSPRDRVSRAFNTIYLQDFFRRCESTFTSLQSVVVHTDGTTWPATSLFDIFLDCHTPQNFVTDVEFRSVGSFVASTLYGITLTVEFKELVELWQEISTLSLHSRMRALHGFGIIDDSLATRTHQAFLTRMVYENGGDDSTCKGMEIFRGIMASRRFPLRELNLNGHAWWTHVASPYRAYLNDAWGMLWD